MCHATNNSKHLKMQKQKKNHFLFSLPFNAKAESTIHSNTLFPCTNTSFSCFCFYFDNRHSASNVVVVFILIFAKKSPQFFFNSVLTSHLTLFYFDCLFYITTLVVCAIYVINRRLYSLLIC